MKMVLVIFFAGLCLSDLARAEWIYVTNKSEAADKWVYVTNNSNEASPKGCLDK